MKIYFRGGTAELVLQCKLSFQPNWNYHLMEIFFLIFRYREVLYMGAKAEQLALICHCWLRSEDLHGAAAKSLKQDPGCQHCLPGCFIMVCKAQAPLTSTRIPQGTVVKSGLERDTTNWAEIRKVLRDGGLPHSALTHIKLGKENIKQGLCSGKIISICVGQ